MCYSKAAIKSLSSMTYICFNRGAIEEDGVSVLAGQYLIDVLHLGNVKIA
jgi:hypothetical protein